MLSDDVIKPSIEKLNRQIQKIDTFNGLNQLHKTPWRNGSASDSRSEGCVFKSRRGQLVL